MITERPVDRRRFEQLKSEGCAPLLARLLAARGVGGLAELQPPLDALQPPAAMLGLADAASLLSAAIAEKTPILIVADYDCDGATACALMVRGLRRLGAQVDYLVPNRFIHGYGLTPPIVEEALVHPRLGRPGLLVTVDNGIASIEGVECARQHGIPVLVTDHHLPAAVLPQAAAIVNPNQPGCHFPSKHLAGVGVALYVLMATRTLMRTEQRFDAGKEPPLGDLLDLVAIGTVADLVRLDANNRALVSAGLRLIRSGRAQAGVKALFQVAGVEARNCTTTDIGFALGPRINAAGRLEDISIGIACLLEDDPGRAAALAEQLEQINRERRRIQADMHVQADLLVAGIDPTARSACLFEPGWHEGVVGLVASKLKDRLSRPVFAFAPSAQDPSRLRGSGRSIAGVHLRDALDLVVKREPDLIERFGGHAMAAGLTLPAAHLERFRRSIEQAIRDFSDPDSFRPQTLTDGRLETDDWTLSLVEQLQGICWGQGFPAPLFEDDFIISQQRLLKDRHLRMRVRPGSGSGSHGGGSGGRTFDAVYFNHATPLAERTRLAFQLAINEFNGNRRLELIIRAAA